MGEFGFITADGVYHVTVYATDENGSFKILSMRNIKISERKYRQRISLNTLQVEIKAGVCFMVLAHLFYCTRATR